MTDVEAEWILFILPFVTIPAVIFWVAFFKYVAPVWFNFLEKK
jgi:hypothetical protein